MRMIISKSIFMLVIMTAMNALATDAYVNFQRSDFSVPSGYVQDVGALYDTGRGYGWDTNLTGSVYTRTQDSDPRLNTFVIVHDAQPKWVYDIANGDYKVTLAAGDAQADQGPHRVAVEGTIVINDQSTAGGAFITVTDHLVTVTNGQLYITIGGNGANNTALNYIDIVGTGSSISYASDEFVEAKINNGSIDNSSPMLVNLLRDTFTGGTNALFAASNYSVPNLPTGLSVVMTNVNGTQLSISLNDNATDHAFSDSITDLTIAFSASAFTSNSLPTGVTNNALKVTFVDRTLSYGGTVLSESLDDDGSIKNKLTLSLEYDTFTAAVASHVTVGSIPLGLISDVQRVSDTEITVSLSGNANNHAASGSITNLSVVFADGAFASGSASTVSNYSRSDISVEFIDAYYVAETGDDANDGSKGSPFATITKALAQPTITVVEILTGTITESNIDVSAGIIIRGQGADRTILQASANPGSGVGNIISISAEYAVVQLEGLTLRNGCMPNGQWGGGAAVILNSSAGLSKNSTLIVNACSFENNSASGNGGGAIYVRQSSLEVYDSTFFANSATNRYSSSDISGGAIYGRDLHGGRIVNSTFSDNQVKRHGGGIAINSLAGYTSEVYNCTFVTNTAVLWGGGIIGNGGVVLVESCLFADNVALASGAAMYQVSYSNTVYEGAVYGCVDKGGNQSTGDAMIDTTLADNGGDTMTHALLEDSPAIDKGSNPAGLSNDQRGIKYERVINSIADCGAYEYGSGPAAGWMIVIK